MFLIRIIDAIHFELCPDQTGTWQDRAKQALEAARKLKPVKLIFEDKWTSPHNNADSGFYRSLNGIEAQIFMSASYQGKVIPYPNPEFKKCLGFVGGFTDEYFFDKAKIEKLSKDQQEIFLKFIKDQERVLKN